VPKPDGLRRSRLDWFGALGLARKPSRLVPFSTVTFGLSAEGSSLWAPAIAERRKVGGASLLASGTVKWFDEENGYGFISADEGGRDLFVHRGSIVGDWRTRTLSEGTRVGFEPREGGMGPEAIHVLPLSLTGSP